MTELTSFNLSDQALGAVMMALQRSLMDQSDIVPVLKGLDFVPTAEGLVVKNPPIVKLGASGMVLLDEEDESLVAKPTS
jgi:hypothetical protein|tara:strand:+ start:949 stop:1185 length:237 start_codon:yes stop_codon:yes gene_type:complete